MCVCVCVYACFRCHSLLLLWCSDLVTCILCGEFLDKWHEYIHTFQVHEPGGQTCLKDRCKQLQKMFPIPVMWPVACGRTWPMDKWHRTMWYFSDDMFLTCQGRYFFSLLMVLASSIDIYIYICMCIYIYRVCWDIHTCSHGFQDLCGHGNGYWCPASNTVHDSWVLKMIILDKMILNQTTVLMWRCSINLLSNYYLNTIGKTISCWCHSINSCPNYPCHHDQVR